MNTTDQYKESIYAALRKREISLYFLSEEQLNDKKIVLEAIRGDPWNYTYVPILLKNNQKIIRFTLKKGAYLIMQIPKKFQSYQKILMTASKQSMYGCEIAFSYQKGNRCYSIYRKLHEYQLRGRLPDNVI